MFSSEFCEIFKNSFFIQQLQWLLLWMFDRVLDTPLNAKAIFEEKFFGAAFLENTFVRLLLFGASTHVLLEPFLKPNIFLPH